MGIVYKAEDTKLERTVAIKFLPRQIASSHEERKRFKIEARAAAALNHPNIATIYAIEEVDDEMFIVMEYIDGQELREIVGARRSDGTSMPLDSVLNYAIQIAEGLKVAHEKGVVHRDIKSANIMITDKGQIKIMDFGLAKLSGQTQLTKEGTTVGTLAYMSPEQAQGTVIDHRTDIWAFGVVLYEMLSGELPFRGHYEQAVIYSIMNEDPEPIPDLQGDVAEALKRVVDKALAKRLDERYRLMDDVLVDLRTIGGEKLADMKSVPAILRVKRHTVGRKKERVELQAGLQNAFAGRGLLMCVAGEPGIGKTTLVEEFLDEVTGAGPPCTIARGRCSERLAGTEAYLPFLEVLESLLKGQADESVVKMMREMAPWWYVQVASLSADDSADARLIEDVKNVTQERMKRELATFLQEVSRARPLLLFFDDLHWSDVSTIDLLAYLASKFDAMRLLIVATYRPEELLLAKHAFLQIKPDLLSRGFCREIELGFLSHEEIERYLALEFPEHDFPANFPALIHSKTEGSPLFMVDLVRYLRDRRMIVEEEGRWTLVQSVADIQLDLPESVRGMIQRKIDQLSEGDRRMLVAAAVQGYEFDSAVVDKVLAMDAAEVEERLQVLDRDHGFVRLIEEQELPDRTLTVRYQFVHVLYQNALYDALTPTRRAYLSKAAAEALLEFYGEQSATVASELAMLFESARDFVRAVDCFCLAARQASQVFAYLEAIALARRGLELLKTLPDTPDTAQQELDLQLALGPVLVATRGFGAPEVGQTYTRILELCQKVEGTAQLFTGLWGMYLYYIPRAEYRKALELAEERLLRLAQCEGDSTLLMLAHHALGKNLFYLGDFVASREHWEEVLNLYNPEQHRPLAFLYGVGDIKVNALCYYTWTLWILGYLDQGLKRLHDLLAWARGLSHPFSLGWALGFAGNMYRDRREVQPVKECAEEGIDHSTEQGFPHWLAQGTMQRGWVLSEGGQEEEGIVQMEQGFSEWKSIGMVLGLSYWPLWLAEGYAKAGRAKEGLSVLADALAMAEETEEAYCVAEVHRLKGELLLMQGEAEAEAETCFRQALDIARRQSAKSYELRAAMSLSRLLQKQGKQEEASEMLNEIYSWFTEGVDTADLKKAKALLEELS